MILSESHGATVHHATWQDLRPLVDRCDALITDCPYSEKTHAGHDEGGPRIEHMRKFAQSQGGQQKDRTYAAKKAAAGLEHRRALGYAPWTPADVAEFVAAWSPVCAGWFVTITDHVLREAWEQALEAAGRYVFAPLPYVAPGSRVRLSGDGPSAWTCWIVVARPRTREAASWGTLPGAYILPPGMAERKPVVGGKESWLLCRLAEDYSRPDGLIVDPCAGACTTAIGAIRTGRRAICGDRDREAAEIGAQWIRNPYGPAPGIERAAPAGQLTLLGGAR